MCVFTTVQQVNLQTRARAFVSQPALLSHQESRLMEILKQAVAKLHVLLELTDLIVQ